MLWKKISGSEVWINASKETKIKTAVYALAGLFFKSEQANGGLHTLQPTHRDFTLLKFKK